MKGLAHGAKNTVEEELGEKTGSIVKHHHTCESCISTVLSARLRVQVIADGLVIESFGLVIDEASLTGESDPMHKGPKDPWCRSGTQVHAAQPCSTHHVAIRDEPGALGTLTTMNSCLGPYLGARVSSCMSAPHDSGGAVQ